MAKKSLLERWRDWREERRLAKKGQTNKSRYEEKERYRAVEKRLTLAITAVFIALVIVLLFTFYI
ncbi:hypothetical protein B8A42_05640 [Dolosigranulum pigrum]|jgi:hypothetical protein|uniref:hypothetical protein n=1 Tax=Dolosigranulum pigrum TaxID=29394 RepID=UPI000DBF5DF6|nr:hypothetical protein [Dolosigranulum pigrum]QTJ34835.1 hypothetical protein FE322_05575 [Dolosigranulum pigrum]RAN54681.1 hypothetical protein B8A42_05640 [Dolosigranulum pigrum]